MPFPLAPIEEQQAIVSEVEKYLSMVDKFEYAIDQNLKYSNNLRQAILKSAFTGMLVQSNPDDEHASILLQRVKPESTKHGDMRKISNFSKNKLMEKQTKLM